MKRGTAEVAHDQQGMTELTTFVQSLLQQMQTRFNEMSTNIVSRIDEMGDRIDDLEKSILDLTREAGGTQEPSHAAASQASTNSGSKGMSAGAPDPPSPASEKMSKPVAVTRLPRKK